jgi:hypothetical protein
MAGERPERSSGFFRHETESSPHPPAPANRFLTRVTLLWATVAKHGQWPYLPRNRPGQPPVAGFSKRQKDTLKWKGNTVFDFENLVGRYLAAWNEDDDEARRKAVSELWADDGAYTDPLAQVAGHEAIAAVIAGARQMFPGFVFTPAGPVEGHHDIARFAWNLGPAGAEPVVVGFDVVQVAADGRLRRVHGFLDKVPQ